MKKVIFGVVLLVILGLVARGIQRSISASKEKVQGIAEIQQETGVPVFVSPVLKQSIQETRIYSGTIKGKEQADATAKIMERLEEVLVKVGVRVRKGQVVARLSRHNPGARLQQARLALENAEKEYKRIEALYKEGAVSQRDCDNAELQYKIAKEDFEAAGELLDVISPIRGVVTEVFHDPGVTVVPGNPIIRIASLRNVELEIEVSEADILGIKKNQKAFVSVSGTNRIFEGAVNRISLSADPEKRNFRVWIALSNEEGLLRPGVFATACLVVKESPESLIIEKDGIVKGDSGLYVFVVNGDNIAERRQVIPGISSEKHIQVLEGVKEGEKVVVLGKNKLTGGEKVQIVEQ